MLPLEHFEENKEVNESLDKIATLIESNFLSFDIDKMSIDFLSDCVFKEIEKMSWKIQSINDELVYALLDIIEELDASKYLKLRESIRDFNGYYDD